MAKYLQREQKRCCCLLKNQIIKCAINLNVIIVASLTMALFMFSSFFSLLEMKSR